MNRNANPKDHIECIIGTLVTNLLHIKHFTLCRKQSLPSWHACLHCLHLQNHDQSLQEMLAQMNPLQVSMHPWHACLKVVYIFCSHSNQCILEPPSEPE